MVWINNQHINIPGSPNTYGGGAMCICKKCSDEINEKVKENTEQKHPNQKAHIYTARKLKDPIQIKLLCTNKWVGAAEETPDISHRDGGYKINEIHQWSIGAGHNADCPICLIKYAERKMKTDNKMMRKIIELAKGHVLTSLKQD